MKSLLNQPFLTAFAIGSAAVTGLSSVSVRAEEPAPAPAAPDLSYCRMLTGDWVKKNVDGGETFYPEIRTTATDACEVFTYTHFETALGKLATFHYAKGVEITDSHFGRQGIFDGETATLTVHPEHSGVKTHGVHRQMTPQGLAEASFDMTVSYDKEPDELNFSLVIHVPGGDQTVTATYKRQ